ncbi:hypothetical protein C8A05DRAFT_35450 [Staphylotrichum tortipilum]|uniref:N-acetyltransferase domain-containing protein n=1 Tax=Staphylotrichum tortipilum TaxID=2831512 RepID=A0AAN6MHQ6_9PEZI|nr:hypothetical protein C8A05DRAFT_35450 [Staphylotrichum longicolle]
MPPPHEIRCWTRRLPSTNGTGNETAYTISTDPSLIDLAAVNAAFSSDMLYWAKSTPPETIKLFIEQSLCFGLYVHPEDPKSPKEMIGLARLITDYATFGYLTDVYVLAPYQGRGLGRWLMACLDEVLASWPHLRRCLLFTRGEAAVRMYGETIGAKDVGEGSFLRGLVLLERGGGGVGGGGG